MTEPAPIVPLVFPQGTKTCEEVRITRPTLGGRVSMMDNAYSAQIFGSMATDATTPETTFVPLDTIVAATGIDQQPPQDACERLWRIRTAGVEQIRFDNNPQAPLTRTQIANNSADGLGQVSGVKIIVTVGASSGFTQFRMDVGNTLDIVGFRLSVSLLSTASAIEVGSNRDALPPGTRSGVIFDTIVGFALHMIEEVDCHCETVFTQRVLIPNNVAVDIEIPKFATAVKAQYGLGVAGASWEKLIGTGVFTVGFLEFVAAGTTSTDESADLGNATFLRTDVAAGARFVTLIWTIRP
jgi:hypothetical protein